MLLEVSLHSHSWPRVTATENERIGEYGLVIECANGMLTMGYWCLWPLDAK